VIARSVGDYFYSCLSNAAHHPPQTPLHTPNGCYADLEQAIAPIRGVMKIKCRTTTLNGVFSQNLVCITAFVQGFIQITSANLYRFYRGLEPRELERSRLGENTGLGTIAIAPRTARSTEMSEQPAV
jgi:hypothetical protein